MPSSPEARSSDFARRIGPTVDQPLPFGNAGGARLPWWAKMAAKLVIARLLPRYSWRRWLGIGVHSYAAGAGGHPDSIARDIAWCTRLAGRAPQSLLELGPGDTLANALYAAAAGIPRIWLVDVGDFASADMDHYRAIAGAIGPDFAARVDFASREAMLASIGATYLTDGLASLAAMPAACVDLSLSYTVLEHVRRGSFAGEMAELRRVTAPEGIGLHVVDLMDHLGGGLNNLRFGDRFWEHDAVAAAGFYTNRLSRADILAIAAAAGFEAAIPFIYRWPGPAIARRALHPRFASRTADDLTAALFVLALHRPA